MLITFKCDDYHRKPEAVVVSVSRMPRFKPDARVQKAIGPLKPVSRTTLSEQVAMQLAAEIDSRRWQPGDKLPSEAELCRVFNVGRSTLREALKSLSFIGMIRMRAGGGSYVSEQPPQFGDRRLLARDSLGTEKNVTDLSEARLLLETELASLCARRATARDLAMLGDLVRKMKAAKDGDRARFQQLDVDFHLSIAASSKNEILAELLSHIRGALQELIRKSLLLPNGTELAFQQHQEILNALRQRNAARARHAMRIHLTAFQRGYNVLLRSEP